MATSVFFGSLVGIAFLTTFGSLGAAISRSLPPSPAGLPADGVIVLIAICVVVLLAAAFMIASFVAAKISPQRLWLDSVFQSLSTWALVGVLISIAVLGATVANNFGQGVDGALLLTDIQVMNQKAVTTIRTDDGQGKKSLQDQQADKVLTAAWWVVFASLITGCAASVTGGMLARKYLTQHH